MEQILEAREERYNIILKLIREYKLPVVCGKANYPGPDKNTAAADKIFKVLADELDLHFKDGTVLSKTMEGHDGKSIILVVDMEASEAKKLGVTIEEKSRLGRVMDIDIYPDERGSISRRNLNLPLRKCIICQDDPSICRRLDRHSLQDVLDKIDKLVGP